jgi:hypothetical protein
VLARKSLPSRNKEIGTPHGKGRVVDILPLKDSVVVLIEEQTFEVHRDQIVPLEEWEALQKRAAEPCQGGENCTCGLHKPHAQEAATPAPAAPLSGERKDRSERRHQRLSQRAPQRQNQRPESPADSQPPAQPKREPSRPRPRPQRKQRPPRPA